MFKRSKNTNAVSNRTWCRKKVVYKAVNELLSADAVIDLDENKKWNKFFVAREEGIEAIDSTDARNI